MATAATEDSMLPYADRPEFGTSLRALQAVVQALRAQVERGVPAKDAFELEWRFGKHRTSDGRFEAGVSRRFAQRLLDEFEVQHAWQWERTTDWVESVDTFYRLAPQRRKKRGPTREIRTRSTFDACATAPSVSHIEKQRVSECRFLGIPRDERLCDRREVYDVRVSLSRENPVVATALPASTESQFVRIQCRRSFLLKHWKIEISQVWDGYTHAEAEKRRRSTPPQFEVECECRDVAAILAERSDVHVAASLLHKALLMYPEHTLLYNAVSMSRN